jgi:hypothetical protein
MTAYHDAHRGTGRTKKQMEALPQCALFVWCNDKLEYPKNLRNKIGRLDIQVVGPSYILDNRWQGGEFTAIEVDHDYNGFAQRGMFYTLLEAARTRIRKS